MILQSVRRETGPFPPEFLILGAVLIGSALIALVGWWISQRWHRKSRRR